MIYFTADLHLGHANIIRHCGRPFADADEMDACLVAAWNKRVRANDTVYIVGDFIFRNARPPEEYLEKLNGKKHLLIGNHDKDWLKKCDTQKYFESVGHYAEISDGQHRMTLCHYPMMSWHKMGSGAYMVHGHIHNGRGGAYFPLLQSMPNLLNAGVDINGFQPVNFDELVRNNERFKAEQS